MKLQLETREELLVRRAILEKRLSEDRLKAGMYRSLAKESRQLLDKVNKALKRKKK